MLKQLKNSNEAGGNSTPASISEIIGSLKYAILLVYYVAYRILNDYNIIPQEVIDATIDKYIKMHGENEGYQIAKAELNNHIYFWNDFYYLSQALVAMLLCLFLLHDGPRFVNKFKPRQPLVSGVGLSLVFACSVYCGFELYNEVIGRYDRIVDSKVLTAMTLGFVIFFLISLFREMTNNSAKRNWQIIVYRIKSLIK